MARGIQSDKIDGTVIRILAGPVTMRGYLVQNFFASMLPMLGVSTALGILGMIIHGWGLEKVIGLVLIYSFLAATSIGLSFTWSCIFKNAESATLVFTMMMMLVVFISGMMLPLSIIPDAIQYVGALFPAQWAVRAIEALNEYGLGAGTVWLSLLAMSMFAIAYLLYGGKRRII
jgi:ABC-2 type transport system permease protein